MITAAVIFVIIMISALFLEDGGTALVCGAGALILLSMRFLP